MWRSAIDLGVNDHGWWFFFHAISFLSSVTPVSCCLWGILCPAVLRSAASATGLDTSGVAATTRRWKSALMSLCVDILIKYITWSLAGRSGPYCLSLLPPAGLCVVFRHLLMLPSPDSSNILVHIPAEVPYVYSLRGPGPRLSGLSEPTVLQLWTALACARTL